MIGLSVAGLAVATPANAAPTGCDYRWACIWDSAGYVTAGSGYNEFQFQYYVNDFGTWNYDNTGLNAGNSANSAFNNGATDGAYFADNINGGGAYFHLSRNSGDADFGNGVPGRSDGYFNNRLSSGYFATFW